MSHIKKNVLLVSLAVLVACVIPIALGNDYYITIACQVLIYCIATIGLNFITGLAGQMNMGTAAIISLGAYATSILSTRSGVSPWISTLFAIFIGVLIGIGLGFPTLRVSGVYLSLTTIGFCEIVRIVIMNLDYTGRTSGISGIPHFNLFGMEIKTPMQNYYFVMVILCLLWLVANRIIRSKWGRAFIAVRDNEDAVASCGISVARVKVTAFTLAAVFGAISGSLYAHFYGYINSQTFNTDLSLNFVVMLIVGGMGNLWGCLIGATVITLLPELLRNIGSMYRLVYGVIMLLVVLFIPGGIVSLIKKYSNKRRRAT